MGDSGVQQGYKRITVGEEVGEEGGGGGKKRESIICDQVTNQQTETSTTSILFKCQQCLFVGKPSFKNETFMNNLANLPVKTKFYNTSASLPFK